MAVNRFLIASLPVAALAAAAAPCAYAIEYLTVEAAQKLMFPDAARFVPVGLNFTHEQWRAIDAKTHASSQARRFLVFRAERDGKAIGTVYVDEVIGKTELITYAVAIGADHRIKQVEILAYRESHGYEVRNPRWRDQFVGKGIDTPVVLGDDISSISGATLSCRHLTDGVRRILAVHATQDAS